MEKLILSLGLIGVKPILTGMRAEMTKFHQCRSGDG
ncbi:hypothetical protein QFZ72_004991 [Bacillus sp. V2I10]|nr:hypothetical protein [Bacillus sp. V2I10]